MAEPDPAAGVPPLSDTPQALAERILTSRAGVEGERKHVTILFADVKDSLELIARRDPEEARRLLDPVLEIMMDAVHRYEGMVNQVMGDGVMAIFGAPLAYEDHAVRACYAALAMRDGIHGYAERLAAAHGVAVRARIGINSGEVVVRSIGSDLRMDYTAVGPATHLAARMEQLAAPETICLSAETRRLAEPFVRTRPLGPVSVKGVAEPVEIFELLGAWPTRTPWQARMMRGLTPFVGRAADLARLRQAAEWTEAGHGQLVGLVGEPGVGKSRLAWEFATARRARGWLVVEAAGISYGRTTALRPLTDLLRMHFELGDDADPRAARVAIARRLQALDQTLVGAVPALLDLMRLPLTDDTWATAEPAQRRERIQEAVRDLVLAESRARPVLLLLEDLHWVDGQTQGVVDHLVEVLPAARVMVLATYRPEYRHPWASRDCFTELHLDALIVPDADRMLHALLGADPGLLHLKRRLVDRTEGNPFFLEECVRALAAAGVLAGRPGAYTLATELTNVEVPATVQAVLAARIDRLAPEDKRLLQTAAVIGRRVPSGVLRCVAELPADELRERLARLQAAALLVEGVAGPEPVYLFPHALTQEVAYRSVLLERRRALHGQLVDAMERLYGDRRAEHAELLGHHAARGERWAAAVTYLRRAAAHAAGRSEYPEAVAFLRESLAAADQLPPGEERTALQIDLRFELRNALWARGRLVEGLDHLRQAEPLAVALGDRRRLTRLLAHQGSNYLVLGDNARALEYGERTLSLARQLDDVGLQVDGHQFLGVLYTSLGDFRQALHHLDANVRLLVGEHRRGRFGHFYAVHARTWRVWCLAELGRLHEAAAAAAAARRIADEARHPHNVVAACWASGYLDRLRGRAAAAADALNRAYALCETAGIALWLRPTAALLGHAYAWLGRTTEGIRLLEQAVRPGENNVAVAAWKVFLGEAYLLAGRLGDAETTAHSAAALAGERGERGFAAHARAVLGAIATRRGRRAEAAEHYRRALEQATALGMRLLEARCHGGLALLERQRGRARAAREHGRAGERLCRAMGIRPRDLAPAPGRAS